MRRHLHLLCGCAPLLHQCVRLLLMRWLFLQRSWRGLLWLLGRSARLLLWWSTELLVVGLVPAMLLLLRQPAVCSCCGTAETSQ